VILKRFPKEIFRFRTVFAFLLLLIAWAVAAAAQSSRGTLTVSLQVVPSTVLIFGEDGKTRIIEANGANGLTVTTIEAPVTSERALNVGVMRTNAAPTTTQQATPASVVGTQSE
jgi:hypothetical protein